MGLHGHKVVLLGLNEIVCSPFIKPFAILILGNHLQLLLLKLCALYRQLQATHSLSQQALTQGVKRSDLEFVEVPALVPISYVFNFSFEGQ